MGYFTRNDESISPEEKANNIFNLLCKNVGDGCYFEIWEERMVNRVKGYIDKYAVIGELKEQLWKLLGYGKNGPTFDEEERIRAAYDDTMDEYNKSCI
ncbi:MAG: hypothetical protein ACYCSQ_00370 [bacterium]